MILLMSSSGRPFTRRTFLQSSAALSLAAFPNLDALTGGSRPHVVVVGAGAFGGWTALALVRAGARVTLIDAWGPGNSRSSSGGETRMIRAIYGGDRVYIDWVARSFEVWKAAEKESRRPLHHRTGALWMFPDGGDYAASSIESLGDAGIPVESWTPEHAADRFPQIDLAGVESVWYEPEAGYLLAREACSVIRDLALASGAEWRTGRVTPGVVRDGRMSTVAVTNADDLQADHYVFACGPWLGELFPSEVGARILPTRQEIFYFGTPSGTNAYTEGALPAWIDFGERIFYGVPGNRWRGFKIADDTRGEPADPTTMERTPTPSRITEARDKLASRFPGLADAPLLESRVCQYENSPDGDFIIDRHPRARNVWLVGGGSGHGFKIAPALGEHVAAVVLGQGPPLEKFSLDRFQSGGSRRSQFGEGRW